MANSLDVESFLMQFFKANHCEVDQSERGKIIVKLTIEMDKALMNRPFYWQYVESTGNIGEPKTITFITDIDRQDGEWIHFGSPRLATIYQFLSEKGKFIHLFQSMNVTENTMLQPWLLTNYCIMYEGKQKKEELLSIGLNLINGTFVFNMMDQLSNLSLEPVISNQCYTISPLIKPQSGLLRIENYLDAYVGKQEHHWAVQSMQLLQEEMAMIHHFYEDKDEQNKLDKELEEVTARLQPKITYKIMSGGIVYLTKTSINI